MFLVPFSKISYMHILVTHASVYLWGLISVSLFCVSIFMPVLYCFDYYIFIYSWAYESTISHPGIQLIRNQQYIYFFKFQFSSVVQSCPTLWPPGLQQVRLPCSSPLPELTQTHFYWVGDAIQPSILCCPLLLLPSIFPSIRVLSNESVFHIRWPKYWSFSFSISSSNEYSGLISFRMDWLDLLAIQESSPTPQFKSITSSKLSFLSSPTLTSIPDYWKNHSFE